MYQKNFKNLFCPTCKTHLSTHKKKPFCLECNTYYPIIKNLVPILISSPLKSLTKTIIQYEILIEEFKKSINSFEIQKKTRSRDIKFINDLKQAYEINISLFENLKNLLVQNIDINEFTKNTINLVNHEDRYDSNLNYLNRDWSQTPEFEYEISSIIKNLKPFLNDINFKDKPVLFLGAGLGRIPSELTAIIPEIYAIDNSLTMGGLFTQLFHEDIQFYDIQFKNIEYHTDIATPVKASMSNYNSKVKKVKYIVADALNLPFPKHFFSAVVSIYFSDVVPLDKLLKELNRVISPNGSFIHYGPLEYHFNDNTKMYAFDEFKKIFIDQGYNFVNESKISGTHCKPKSTSVSRIYTNWIVEFQKEKIHTALSDESILKLNNRFIYSKVTSIENEKIKTEMSLRVNDDTFIVEDSIADILCLIDGKKNIKQLISDLEIEYDHINDNQKEKILTILLTLTKNMALKVIDKES